MQGGFFLPPSPHPQSDIVQCWMISSQIKSEVKRKKNVYRLSFFLVTYIGKIGLDYYNAFCHGVQSTQDCSRRLSRAGGAATIIQYNRENAFQQKWARAHSLLWSIAIFSWRIWDEYGKIKRRGSIQRERNWKWKKVGYIRRLFVMKLDRGETSYGVW